MSDKIYKISIYFARKGERDLLPTIYKNRRQADLAAYNINKNDPNMDARVEEAET